MRIFAIFLINILLSLHLFASENKWEGMILKKMLQSIVKDRAVCIYTKDKSLQKEFSKTYRYHIVDECQGSDFVLLRSNEHNGSCYKPTIVFNYYDYLHMPTAIGVFFWQKGRPTIRFSKKRLNHFNLEVTGELSKFVSSGK